MTWTHRTMAVTAAHRDLADLLCSTLAPGQSGADMWVIRLGASAAGPVTHYGCTGLIQSEFAGLLADPATTHYLAAQAGLTCTPEEVTALLSESLISDGTVIDAEGNASEAGWREVYAAAGLYVVRDEETL